MGFGASCKKGVGLFRACACRCFDSLLNGPLQLDASVLSPCHKVSLSQKGAVYMPTIRIYRVAEVHLEVRQNISGSTATK